MDPHQRRRHRHRRLGTVISTELMQQGGWQFQTRGRSSGDLLDLRLLGRAGAQVRALRVRLLQARELVARDGRPRCRGNLSLLRRRQARGATEPSPPPILPGAPTLFMGKWMGAGRLFSGSLDDVAIYSRALSAAEVAELHKRSPPPPK